MRERVAGFCPMGCGPTLFLGSGGYITCSRRECPDPTAVATLLDDRETQHLVELHEGAFTIKHPLRERLQNKLLTCTLPVRLETYLDRFGPALIDAGHFRARELPDGEWMLLSVPAGIS